MGGGGTMRAAAKLAGIGVAKTGFRGASYPAEQSLRNASRQPSTVGVSSQGGARVAEVTPLHTAASSDLSDWEFPDSGDMVMSAGEPLPRVVFGEAPTLQEAKEATAELKDAIDQIYFSSGYSECEDSSSDSQGSVVSSTIVEPVTKSCVVEAISSPSVPKHAIHAFQLLSTNPEAQTVVASIACDPNIWKAVMQNPAVTNFFESQLTVEGTPGVVVESTNGAADADSQMGEDSLQESQSGLFFDFMGLLQNLKLTVTEMVSRMTNFLQNIFPTAEKDNSSSADGASFMDSKNIMGGSFLGLAVLAIMVVLMKRA